MKIFLFGMGMMLCSLAFFSQATDTLKMKPPRDYLRISKEHNVGGFILPGVGVLAIAAVAPGKVDFGTAGIAGVGGTLAILGCIPLFIASGRNKRKARRISAGAGVIRSFDSMQASNTMKYLPALTLKLRF